MTSRLALVVALLSSAACSSTIAPTAATPTAQLASDVAYAINVPTRQLAETLNGQYPDGVRVAPLTAQAAWDYTATYQGTPNVYYGENPPPCGYPYVGVGIVIAPRHVAGMETFSAADWPGLSLVPGVAYSWVGRFVHAQPAAPGSYTIDPACLAVLH